MIKKLDKLRSLMSSIISVAVIGSGLYALPVSAHEIGDEDNPHPHYDSTIKPPQVKSDFSLAKRLAQLPRNTEGVQLKNAPSLAAMFAPFSPDVRVRWDERFLYIESDGMPAHRMMVGITAWQQQVPLPQAYTGDNAWRIPLAPVPAEAPLSAKTNFFRGAIALAANGVPIFNPIKNDGHTDTFLAGELDEFGGHSGRADDYHYHIAPLHLQAQTGAGKPIAVALDGYSIYGLTEPDGSATQNLDAFNGHATPALGYHYHSSKAYPYLNGGFHGAVTQREGQVDPQPRAFPARPALPPLPGATITGFEKSPDGKAFTLKYLQNGQAGQVRYSIADNGEYRFQYVAADGKTTQQTYKAEANGDEKTPPPGENGRADNPPPPREEGENRPPGPRDGPDPNDPNRKPWIADHLAEMDTDGDGVLSLAELTGEIQKTFTGYDRDRDGLISTAEGQVLGGVRSAMGGFVKGHWNEVDANNDGQITLAELSALGRKMFNESDRNGDGNITPDELNATAAPPGEQPAGRDNNAPGAPNNAIVKPEMKDTIAANVYADNWFALYINGKLRIVDPIAFLPHNVVSVDILPEYPMTIAVIAHDNADPKTGMEYGTQIGDAGFVLKFADGTVTDATWKAKAFERGPLDGDTRNPRVQSEALPANWFAPDFDDSKWPAAHVFTEQEVNPKAPFYEHDFKGAQFIWSSDLALDNTVLFRKTIEKPNWKPRLERLS